MATLSAILICLLLPVGFFLRRYFKGLPHANKPHACKQFGSSPHPVYPSWPNRVVGNVWERLHAHQGKHTPIAARVNSLYVHPIKSCRAVKVEKAEVMSTGLKYDRQFTFAELQNPEGKPNSASSGSTGWHFVTQRKYGRLANIHLEIWVPNPESPDYSPDQPNVVSDGVLRVRYPDPKCDSRKPELKYFDIPYCPTEDQVLALGFTMEQLTVWKDRPNTLLVTSTTHTSPPAWIKDIQAYIGCSKPFALFRVAAGHNRQVFRNAPGKQELGYQSVTGFADSYPLHILGLSSVADLDRKLVSVMPELTESTALRFRANIYFEGPAAFAEDSWKSIRIGQSIYYVACRTTRCELPNTDQRTGKKHLSQPSKLMRSYRNIDPGAGVGKACLGMQMVPAAEWGIIKVGDAIEVLETGAHHYILQ
ncbi:MAG: hypothetical protein Q9178_002168 [Gyalolechia marmorata]